MSGFAPDPGAAPRPLLVTRHAALEIRMLVRNGEQLVLALVIPVVVLVGGNLVTGRFGIGGPDPVQRLAPAVLALAILSTSFTSLAIGTGFERRYGVLAQLATTPLSRGDLLAGKVLSLLAVQAGQIVVLAAVGVALGWSPSTSPVAVLAAIGFWWLGCASFAAWALAIAGRLRAETTLALANLVFVMLVVAGGVVAAPAAYGGAAGLVRLLPSAALADGLRSALGEGRVDLGAAVVLVVWAVAGSWVTTRTFRWD